MSRPHKPWLHTLVSALIAYLLALGFGMPLLAGLTLSHFIGYYAIGCAIVIIALSVLRLKSWILGIGVSLFLLFEAALYFFAERGLIPVVIEIISALSLWLSGSTVSIHLIGKSLCRMFCIVIPAISMMLSLPDAGLYTVVSLVASILGGMWAAGLRGLSMYMLPVLPALLLLYASTHAHTPVSDEAPKRSMPLSTLPIAAVLLSLTVLLSPAEGTKSAALSAIADQLHEWIDDHFFFQDERTRYSLEADGWMPLGQDRLGGEPAPNEQAILMVETDQTVYLRGAILDAYTGAAWYDSISAKRYGWNAAPYQDLRNQVFELSYPLVSDIDAGTVHIKSIANGPSTLFVPQRIRSLTTSDRMVTYFNIGSEIFITRNLAPENAYAADYLSMNATDEGMAALIAANAGVLDDRFADISAQYMSIPAHMQQEVYDIAATATRTAASPWQKATALRNYLRTRYPYSLDVEQPPADVDFIAWFLLAEQKGYCTYFASAMTILCRMAGLPARYVEGYLVSPDPSGTTIVRGTNAHAWTEVYFNGVGWVVFDATPGFGENDRSGEDNAAPPATPSPTPTPSLSPSQPPSGPDATPTPTPAPDVAPTNTPDPPVDAPDTGDSDPAPNMPWLWLLLIISCILLLSVRIRMTEPLYCATKADSDEKAMMLLWRAINDSTKMLKHPRLPSETPFAYAARIDSVLGVSLLTVADAISAMRYGRHQPPRNAVQNAMQAYTALSEQMTLWQKFRLAIRRAFRLSPGKHSLLS